MHYGASQNGQLLLRWDSYDSSRINHSEYLIMTHTKTQNGIVTTVVKQGNRVMCIADTRSHTLSQHLLLQPLKRIY